MFEPISVTGCVEADPGKFILPIRYVDQSPSLPPVLAEYWQWVLAASPTAISAWVRVVVMTVLLVVACPFASAQDVKVRFPQSEAATMLPAGVTKLTGDSVYVIDADIPVLVLASPKGLVSITEEAGPIRVRGKFADGAKVETRTYKGKHVFIIEATGVGTVELLVVPHGVTKESEVIRKTLDVDNGQAPKPPPAGKVAHVTFIGPEKSAEATATNNSATLRKWLADRGINVHGLVATSSRIVSQGFQEKMDEAGIVAPAIILQDAGGNVITIGRLTTEAAAVALTTPYTK